MTLGLCYYVEDVRFATPEIMEWNLTRLLPFDGLDKTQNGDQMRWTYSICPVTK